MKRMIFALTIPLLFLFSWNASAKIHLDLLSQKKLAVINFEINEKDQMAEVRALGICKTHRCGQHFCNKVDSITLVPALEVFYVNAYTNKMTSTVKDGVHASVEDPHFAFNTIDCDYEVQDSKAAVGGVITTMSEVGDAMNKLHSPSQECSESRTYSASSVQVTPTTHSVCLQNEAGCSSESKNPLGEGKNPVKRGSSQTLQRVLTHYGAFLEGNIHKFIIEMYQDKLASYMLTGKMGRVDYDYREHLDIDLSPDEVDQAYKKSGVIQLRQVPASIKKLVIGCGNGPFIDHAEAIPLDGKYRHRHMHEGEITINPYLAYNPTVAGLFGEQEMPMLRKGHYSKIEFEGYFPSDAKDAKRSLLAAKELLSSGGKIYLGIGAPEPFEIRVEQALADIEEGTFSGIDSYLIR